MNILQTYLIPKARTLSVLCVGFILSSSAYSECACKDKIAQMPSASFTNMMVEDDLFTDRPA